MKVLIADDSRLSRRLLAASLAKWQFEVVEADNGAQAWELFQKENYPLVLTDWMMPEMDGLELVSRIRAAELPTYVYIILLTARTEKQDLVKAMEAGADDFLAKPIDQDELRVRVREGERIVRLERALADQNRQLREAQAALVQSAKLASVGQLAAGVAHEINNPVAFVANNLAVLKRDVTALVELLRLYRAEQDGAPDASTTLRKQIEQLEMACDIPWLEENLPQLFATSQAGLARVRQIVSRLKDFAHLDEAEIDRLEIEDAIHATTGLLRREIEQKQLTIVTDLAPLPLLWCHPGKINQVLHSLLLNAIQASSPGKSIYIRTKSEQGGALIEVEDHGTGIDAANLPHLFEPFYTTKPIGQGAGLGLAMSYGVVRDHGGTIHVTSEVGRGSTFRVWLPWQPPTGSAAATA
jgi:signal transduction histidine kinase